MRLTWLDVVATALVGAIVAIYAAFMAAGDLPVRTMALLGLALGTTAYLATGPVTRGPRTLRTLTRAVGLAALGLAIAAVAIGSAPLLAVFIGAVVGLWAVAMLCHVGALGAGEPESPDNSGEALDGGSTHNDAQDEWERNRPGPFVPPGDVPPIPW
jgi:hypothetical protein